MMKKFLSAVSVVAIISLCFYAFFLQKERKASTALQKNSLNKNQVAESVADLEKEKQAIRNKPLFSDQDTGGVEPMNKPTLAMAYKVGGTSVATENNVTVSTKFFNLGDVVREGFGYSATKVSRKSGGQYSKVEMSLHNVNKVPVEVFFTSLKLSDQMGREYLPIAKDNKCVDKDNSSHSEIRATVSPDVPCQIDFLFEVASTSNSFLFYFVDEN